MNTLTLSPLEWGGVYSAGAVDSGIARHSMVFGGAVGIRRKQKRRTKPSQLGLIPMSQYIAGDLFDPFKMKLAT